jgi:SAM-dependent methyltransferase
MMRIDTDRDWEAFGRDDPYYGVITDERFRKDRLDAAMISEFFALGEAHISTILSDVRERLSPDFHPQRALDFGCGVGRLMIPLAQRCDHVVGVDVSESMLAEARRQCEARGLANVELVLGDDTLSRVNGRFNFVHSHIVFQHVAPARGEQLAAALIDRLDAEGVGVLQFTYHSDAPALSRSAARAYIAFPPLYRLRNFLKRKPNEPMIQMNEYDLNRLFLMLQSKGCQHLYARFTDHGVKGIVLMFQKRTVASL